MFKILLYVLFYFLMEEDGLKFNTNSHNVIYLIVFFSNIKKELELLTCV